MQGGLVLWLDARAQRHLMKMGQSKGVWKDLSGNGNDGELVNFDFTEDSGWVDGGLKLDRVDDYVQLPELDLDPDSFTIQVDNKIRAFNGDKVITENGDEWGRNLVLKSGVETTFADPIPTTAEGDFEVDGKVRLRRYAGFKWRDLL